MSWDNVYSWSQGLAVVCAAVALVSGFVVNHRQALEIANLKRSTAEANERTAGIYRKLGPRYFTKDEKKAFLDAVASIPNKPGLMFLIARDDWTNRFDSMFATDIERVLTEAGFSVKQVSYREWNPTPPAIMPDGSIFKETGGEGLRLESTPPFEVSKAEWFSRLCVAFERTTPFRLRGPLSTTHPELVPANGGIIVVGPKPEETFEPPWNP